MPSKHRNAAQRLAGLSSAIRPACVLLHICTQAALKSTKKRRVWNRSEAFVVPAVQWRKEQEYNSRPEKTGMVLVLAGTLNYSQPK